MYFLFYNKRKLMHIILSVSAWCQVSSVYKGIRGPLNLTVHQEYPPKPLFNSKKWGGGGRVALIDL